MADLKPDKLWTNWTNPLSVEATLAGQMRPAESHSITSPKPSGNFVVDINLLDCLAGSGVIKVGSIDMTISMVDSVITLTPKIGDCQSYTTSGDLWLRFGESTIVEEGEEDADDLTFRYRMLEVWRNAPNPERSPLFRQCAKQLLNEDWEQPEDVTIAFNSTNIKFRIAEVLVKDTNEDSEKCPPVNCTPTPCSSGGPFTFLATNARVVCTGFGTYTLTRRIEGKLRNPNTGFVYGPGIWTEYASVDLSSLNGTHSMLLFKDGAQLSPEQTDSELATIQQRGLCRSDATRYEWRFPTIDLRGKYSSGVGSPSAGINFKPFDYLDSGAAALFDLPVNQRDAGAAHPAYQPFYIDDAVPIPTNFVLLNIDSLPYNVFPGFFDPTVTQYVRSWILTGQIGGYLEPIAFAACLPVTQAPVTNTFEYNFSETYTAPVPIGTFSETWDSNTLNVSRQLLADYVPI